MRITAGCQDVSSFALVLDANVLVPAALCDLLLRAASADMFRLVRTDDILYEVRRTLTNDLGKTGAQAARRIEVMKEAFPEALVTHHTALIAAMSNDPKDRHVLAAAVASGAHVIVTSNLSDFPEKSLAPFLIAAQTPDRFLAGLLALDRGRIAEVLSQQAAALRSPPISVDDILDELARVAPTFVADYRR